MKKVIALVLAVALSLSMASVAFAKNWDLGGTASGSSDLAEADDATGVNGVNPGDKIRVHYNEFNNGSNPTIKKEYFSSDYFTIKVEYARGKDLVKEVKFDGEYLVIALKDNVLTRPSVANFQIEKITLTGKKNGINDTNEAYRNKKYALTDPALTTALKVGYIEEEKEVGTDFAAVDNAIVKMKKNNDGDSYGVSVIDFGDASAEVRLYKDEKFFLGTKPDPDLDLVKANPDADLQFLTFTGNPTFSSNAKVEIYADEDKYLYEIKDGKLVESNFKYDEDAGAFVGKARTLGKYVISDMKLVAAATAEETKNPDTGANDVVGVAVALAVVSLVAAGAVSLKK